MKKGGFNGKLGIKDNFTKWSKIQIGLIDFLFSLVISTPSILIPMLSRYEILDDATLKIHNIWKLASFYGFFKDLLLSEFCWRT